MTKEQFFKCAQIKGALQLLDKLIDSLQEQRNRLQKQYEEIQGGE